MNVIFLMIATLLLIALTQMDHIIVSVKQVIMETELHIALVSTRMEQPKSGLDICFAVYSAGKNILKVISQKTRLTC